MGRSATIPGQPLAVTMAESLIPIPVGEVPRSVSTYSVMRRSAGTLTETVLVCAVPWSGVYRYWILTEQLLPVGFPRGRYSLKLPPARPSAKNQVLCHGLAAGGG